MDTVYYGFEELPGSIENGVHFGTFTGSAEIQVDQDHDWRIVAIEIIGKRKNASGTWDDVPTRFEPGDEIFRLLSTVINDHFSDDVDELIASELGVLEDAA